MKTTYSDTQMINATSGSHRMLSRYKEEQPSRLTEQPFVTDNDSATVNAISS